MPKSTPAIFQRSLIAAAVISLSACSSMPQAPDLGTVGDGIVKAGKATANAGKKTWNTTTYLLGFSDSPDGHSDTPTDEQLLIAQEQDDVNQVLPLSDAPAIESTAGTQPAVIQQATAVPSDGDSSADELTAAANNALISETTAPISNDVIHEVAASETLWDIAKLTTGDATNWHVLADVNNLEQNATVFPGQQLIIPGDIAKQEYASTLAATTLEPVTDTQDIESVTVDQSVITTARDVRQDIRLTEQASVAEATSATQDAAQLATDATDATDDAAQLASVEQNASPIELNEGETLWDFAKRTTGDATNWQAIASQNNFTEKQSVTVRPGQTIFVPQSLLKDNVQASSSGQGNNEQTTDEAIIAAVTESPENVAETADSALAAALPATKSLQDSDAQKVAQDGSTVVTVNSASADVGAAAETAGSSLDETQPLTIVEATYKSDDSLNPVNADDDAVQMVENENIPAQIMVSGTYYPKAVYNDADFSSSLLMRVSPGTTLQVSRAMGSWFEVQTEEGVGYVHQRDIQ